VIAHTFTLSLAKSIVSKYFPPAYRPGRLFSFCHLPPMKRSYSLFRVKWSLESGAGLALPKRLREGEGRGAWRWSSLPWVSLSYAADSHLESTLISGSR
jgi:hypothetical protein